MIKKIFATLTGWREKETDFSARTFKEKSAQESREAEERKTNVLDERERREGRRYYSENTAEVPSTEKLLGPSDSEQK